MATVSTHLDNPILARAIGRRPANLPAFPLSVTVQPHSVRDVLSPCFAEQYASFATGGRSFKNLERAFADSKLPKPWPPHAGHECNKKFRRLVFRVLFNLRTSSLFETTDMWASVAKLARARITQRRESTTPLSPSSLSSPSSPPLSPTSSRLAPSAIQSPVHTGPVDTRGESFRRHVSAFPTDKVLGSTTVRAKSLSESTQLDSASMFRADATISKTSLFGHVYAPDEYARFMRVARTPPDSRLPDDVEFVSGIVSHRVDYFRDMPAALVRVFATEMTIDRFDIGQSIFQQYDTMENRFFVILVGVVEIKVTKSIGFSCTEATLRAGATLGASFTAPSLMRLGDSQLRESTVSGAKHTSWFGDGDHSLHENTAHCATDVVCVSVGSGAHTRLKAMRLAQTRARAEFLATEVRYRFFASDKTLRDRSHLEHLERVAARMQSHSLATGRVLIAQGQPCSHLFVVTRGQVALTHRLDMPAHWQRTHSRTFMALHADSTGSGALAPTALRLAAGALLRGERIGSAQAGAALPEREARGSVPVFEVVEQAPVESEMADAECAFAAAAPTKPLQSEHTESVLARVDTLEVGDVFGFLQRDVASYSAVTMAESEVLSVCGQVLLDLLDDGSHDDGDHAVTRLRAYLRQEQNFTSFQVMQELLRRKHVSEFAAAPNNESAPHHLRVVDQDASVFDFSICQGLLPSEAHSEALQTLYDSFDMRTAKNVHLHHVTRRSLLAAADNSDRSRSKTAASLHAVSDTTTSFSRTPPRHELLRRSSSLQQLRTDLKLASSAISSSASPLKMSFPQLTSSPPSVDSATLSADASKVPVSLRQRAKRYPPPQASAAVLSSGDQSFGGLPAALRLHYQTPSHAGQALALSLVSNDEVTNHLTHSSPPPAAPLPSSPSTIAISNASASAALSSSSPVAMPSSIAIVRPHRSPLHPNRAPVVPVQQMLLSSSVIPDLGDVGREMFHQLPLDLWHHAPKAGALLCAGCPIRDRPSARANLHTTSTFCDSTRNAIPFAIGRSPPDLALRHLRTCCAHAHHRVQVKPHALQSHCIEHTSPFDRGQLPTDAPDFAASLSHWAHSGVHTSTLDKPLATSIDTASTVSLPTSLSSAAAFLAAGGLHEASTRARGSNFHHPIQRAVIACTRNSPAACLHDEIVRESLGTVDAHADRVVSHHNHLAIDVVERSSTPRASPVVVHSFARMHSPSSPLSPSLSPQLSLPISPSDPDTKAAFRRAAREHEALEAALRAQRLAQDARDAVAVARRHEQQLASLTTSAVRTTIKARPPLQSPNVPLAEQMWAGNLRGTPDALARMLHTDFPLQLDPMTCKFHYSLPAIASPLAALARSTS